MDFTIHPSEIVHRIRSGHVGLAVFHDWSTLPSDVTKSPYVVFCVVAPLGWLLSGAWLSMGAARRGWQWITLASLLLAVLIEAACLLAPTRSPA